jgi:hypothetical protein
LFFQEKEVDQKIFGIFQFPPKPYLALCLALFAVFFFTAGVFAQNQTFRGSVLDERGDAIPNADVTLTSKDGKERKVKSGFNGEFTIPNVPAGTYSLTAIYEGFQTQTLNDIKFPSGPVTIKLAIAAVEIVTDVSINNQAVSVEPDQNMNATVLGEEFIKNLPDNEDDLRDVLNALAGPTANGDGATIMIDGFNGGRLPPREAIMQIRINQNPFSAEYSNPGFGRVEIITKPGLGAWRGGGGWSYRNAALDARNAFALVRDPDNPSELLKPDLDFNRFNFNIGGPLIKKRLSTFIFGDRNITDGSGNTFAKTLDGDFSANVPSRTTSTFIGARADYLLNNKNTLNFSYNFNQRNTKNTEFAARFGGGFGPGGGGGFGGGGFGGGGFGAVGGSNQLLPERGSDSENRNHTFRMGETWIINSKMIHETRFEYERQYTNQIARTDGVAINVLDAFNGGGSTCCPNTTKSEEFEFQDYLTYTTKGAKHTIKGGVQFEYESISDVSGGNFNGTYTFSSLDQYRMALADPTNPLGRARQFTINRGTQGLDYGILQGSWFVGDDWRLSQGLTFSFGLRHEFQTKLQDKMNFAPRLGIAWSPFKSRKTTIRAGGGIFYDRLRGNQYQNSIRFNGQTQQSYIVRNAIFNPADPFGANQDQLELQNSTLRPLDPNLKAPYDINTSVGVEQQLPKGIVGSVTYIRSRGVHLFRTRNINAPIGFTPNPQNPAQPTPIYPIPNGGFIYETEAAGLSSMNRLQFGFNRRVGRLMTFGNYSLSWIRSNAEGTPADNYDLALEWARANSDSRHNFSTGGFITLPKGFRLNTFINATSGRPFNITTGDDTNQDGSFSDRPLDANGVPLRRNTDLATSYYSLPAFSRLICPAGSVCTAGQGLVPLGEFLRQKYPNGVRAQGPGNFVVNAYLSKTFGFGKLNNSSNQAQGGPGGGGGGGRGPGGGGGRGPGGGGMGGPGGGMVMRGPGGGGGGPMMMGMGNEGSRYNVTVQLGITNLFNRVNYSQYSGTLGSAFFGLPSSSSAARQLEFSLRFGF